MSSTSVIAIEVDLSADKTPQAIRWQSSDNPDGQKLVSCKAMLLSLFDKNYNDTYKIDLWTSEMQISEMDRFMYQTLRSLTDSYYKATNNAELANEMYSFVQYFGEKTGIIQNPEEANQ